MKVSRRQKRFSRYFLKANSGLWHYLAAASVVLIASAALSPFENIIGYQSVSLLLLFLVSLLALFLDVGPITFASVIGAFTWNFLFIPPRFTIHISKPEDVLMFGMFFIIAIVNGILTSRVRKQERLSREREERTNHLYKLTRDLSDAADKDSFALVSLSNIRNCFGIDAVIYLPETNETLKPYAIEDDIMKAAVRESYIAERVFQSGTKAGNGTAVYPESEFTFYPLSGAKAMRGVIALRDYPEIDKLPGDFRIIYLTQISNAAERIALNEVVRKARFLDESDKLYKTLFNSLSHELRIPVASIISATDSLLSGTLPESIQAELVHEIFKASARLNRLIENLLNMSRLESGHIEPHLDWCDIQDILNKVISNLKDELSSFDLKVDVSRDMLPVKVDFGLLEQVLYNLVFNATQYAARSSELEITVNYENNLLIIEVRDRGPGFAESDLPFIFDKFYRIKGSATGGTGLGLSIAKGFTEALHGKIIAENRKGGGACFRLEIPSEIPVVEIE